MIILLEIFLKGAKTKKMLNISKCGFIILFFAAVSVFAQEHQPRSTAQEIEDLLNSKTVTYAQAARFILEAADALATENHDEAFNYAVKQKWLPQKTYSDAPARLDDISLLLMRSFNTHGGILYTITKNSHYAYRELTYLNVIQNRADPAMLVSGEQLIFYVNRILEEKK